MRLISFIACATAVGISFPAGAQSNSADRAVRVQWLQENAIPIRSYAPADTDFADLAAIGAAIGNARVVTLGEQSHGDGTVFLLKTRLIKYLHEKLGFDVLAFESGIYDMKKAWDFVQTGEEPTTALRRGVFGIWSQSAQLLPLFGYVGAQAKAAHPLELSGFDSQLTASASREFLVKDLSELLTRSGVDTTGIAWSAARAMLDTLIVTPAIARTAPVPADRQRLLFNALDSLSRRLSALSSDDRDVAFWRQNLRSLRGQAAFVFGFDLKQGPSGGNPRDAQMAENLLWLANTRYPGRKIIVWAASFHNMRNSAAVAIPPLAGVRTMGDIISPILGEQLYNIGFVASQGAKGPWMSAPTLVVPPPPESIDGLWASTTHALAMVDFRHLPATGDWLRQVLLAGPNGYGIMPATWPQVMDGMIYTRVMEPSTRAVK